MWRALCQTRRRLTGLAYQQYRRALQEFELSQGAVQALRDILALCRQRDIPTALVVMPEGSVFRGWYPPATQTRVEAFLAEFPSQENVPLIDARLWVEDDGFYDGHHMLPSGAEVFTDRLGAAIAALHTPFVQTDRTALASPLDQARSIPAILQSRQSPADAESLYPSVRRRGQAAPGQ